MQSIRGYVVLDEADCVLAEMLGLNKAEEVSATDVDFGRWSNAALVIANPELPASVCRFLYSRVNIGIIITPAYSKSVTLRALYLCGLCGVPNLVAPCNSDNDFVDLPPAYVRCVTFQHYATNIASKPHDVVRIMCGIEEELGARTAFSYAPLSLSSWIDQNIWTDQHIIHTPEISITTTGTGTAT